MYFLYTKQQQTLRHESGPDIDLNLAVASCKVTCYCCCMLDIKHKDFSAYLVCGEYVEEVKQFLLRFYPELHTPYTYRDWISFTVPDTNFRFNLMHDKGEPLTQHMTLEMSVHSLDDLQTLAKEFDCEIRDFPCNETDYKYHYHYIEIPGPHDICKMEISYSEPKMT